MQYFYIKKLYSSCDSDEYFGFITGNLADVFEELLKHQDESIEWHAVYTLSGTELEYGDVTIETNCYEEFTALNYDESGVYIDIAKLINNDELQMRQLAECQL